MIIKTSANQLYFVTETGNTDLAHVWNGLRVKRSQGGFIVVKNARKELVRKAGSRQIADFNALKGAA